jgi:hypothetical protein
LNKINKILIVIIVVLSILLIVSLFNPKEDVEHYDRCVVKYDSWNNYYIADVEVIYKNNGMIQFIGYARSGEDIFYNSKYNFETYNVDFICHNEEHDD